MALRVALVTPFAWSQPNDVNDHVAGLATELRLRGHTVTVLAPSNRARDLAARRRALASGADAELIALGPAVPISRRSRMGVPVGVRANLAVALAAGGFDVVHGFEPGLPSLSYLALRDSAALAAATFFSADRLSYPPGRAQRGRLLGRLDALLATSREMAEAAELRFPGRYELVPAGIDLALFAPAAKRKLVVLEWRQAERPLLRALVRELVRQPDWELVLLRTRPLGGRPTLPRALRGRAHVRTALDAAARAAALRDAAVFVPAAEGLRRLVLEAQASGAAVAAPPGRDLQPELAAAEAARLVEDDAFRTSRAEAGRNAAAAQSFAALADRVEEIYASLARRRRHPAARQTPLEQRDWIIADLHMHTSWSHDCSMEVDDLLDHAEAEGLGAIAITDHNVFGGALEAVEKARGRKLVVIPGEEVKTGGQGEVIGLFLKEAPIRSTACTRSRTRPHCSGISPRSTSSRSTTRACSSRATTTRRCGSRANTTSRPAPARMRTCSRVSAPAPCACAGSTARRNFSSRCEARRFCAVRSRSRTSKASSGWPKPRKGCARSEPTLGLL